MALLATVGIFGANFEFSSAAVPSVNPAVAASTQFDVTGFLKSATLDCNTYPSVSLDPALCGGIAVINGHKIVVPAETVVILPASAVTWAEMFSLAPAPYTGNFTGLALDDTPKPTTTSEVQMIGNRVIDPPGVNGCSPADQFFQAGINGCDRYIAGMVHVSQQDLNGGAGYVNFIDYSNGSLEVGGQPGIQGTGTVVRINDPAVVDTDGDGTPDTGRFGRAFSPDSRFQVDQDNPTISSETGFPMCIPRVDPSSLTPDALCPQKNRPNVSNPVVDQSGIPSQPNALIAGQPYTYFRMDDPANVDNNPGLCFRNPCADPRIQAPFQVGDYVNFSGNYVDDGTTNYMLAHTIVASLGIYTAPGTNPAYVNIEVGLIGTGGLTVFGAGEAAVRTKFEGMATDETRAVHLYGIDINPSSGVTSDRDWGTVMPDPGPPGGAVRGRWRFRPPCTLTPAQVLASPGKGCSPPPGGAFIPPTREVRAVVEGVQQFLPGTINDNPNSQVPDTPSATTTANGIYWGQYHAPIGEYIFPENVPGSAVPENNFNTIPFLAYGGYASITGVQAGVLRPWPSSVTPPPMVCATPTVNGAPYSVANGGSIQLSGSLPAGATTPVTVSWTAGTTVGGTDLNGALTGTTTTTPTFSAVGLAAGTYNVRFAADNLCGKSSVDTTITVTAAPAPTIKPIQDQTVTAGNTAVIIAQSGAVPAPTWTWAQTAGPVVVRTQSPSAATATGTSQISFNPATAGLYTFTVTATNVNGTSSVTTVNVTATAAVSTNITFGGTLEYRIGKQRLVMTATSTDVNVVSMKLMPYLTDSGTIFDPASLGANLSVSLAAPGSFAFTLVGAPRPACNLSTTYATPCSQKPITVKGYNAAGTLIATSAPSGMDKIRN